MWVDSVLWELVVVFVFAVAVAVIYLKHKFGYWNRRNVPQLEPTIPFGNFGDFAKQKKTLGVAISDLYLEMSRRDWRFGGVYALNRPIFVPVDLDVVKFIMTKEFNHFRNRGLYYNEEHDPLSAHLFAIDGEKWKELRQKLSPTFTSGKMKMMFPIMIQCSDQMTEVIDEFANTSQPVDIKDICARFTTDIIGTCAFGIESNSQKDPNSEFRKYGKQAFETSTKDTLINMLILTAPSLLDLLKLRVIKKSVSDFFTGVVRDNLKYRRENKIVRNDFFSLLMKLHECNDGEEKVEGLTFNEVAAQAFIFFLAGFETSSTTMTFGMYELAMHQDIQDRLREEIRTTLKNNNGQMTYEAIMEMKYMDQVVDEILRKYPALPIITRNCVEPIQIPDTKVTIEKGTMIMLSSYGIHMDPKNYPDPEKFDPERFSHEEKLKRHGYSHIPFGEGPRNCIGLRFGLMKTKVGLASLLNNYKFTMHSKTKLPLTLDKTAVILTFKEEFLLECTKL